MILIALGANLPSRVGPPVATLKAALRRLARSGAVPAAVSPFYSSEAWPEATDPPYVNAVVRVLTDFDPAALMSILESIESAFGRVRNARNAPRPLDLDILDYDGRVQSGPPTLPHPRMETRAFVLVPLADIAPGWCHPESGQTIAQLIGALPACHASATNLKRLDWPAAKD